LEGETVVDLWGGITDQAETRPREKDTILTVYSTTKTMTALTALLLADRCELDFDAPVAKYWPEFAANGKERIKISHVMSHASGLSAWREPVAAMEDLYHHPTQPGATILCDFAVEVTRTFETAGEVYATETPGGEVAVAVHRGPYTYRPRSNFEYPLILIKGPLDQETNRFYCSATTSQCEWSWFGCDARSRSPFDGASAIKTAPMITRTATPISSPRATMLRHAWVPMSAA
jgi:hypothetical protein